MKKILIFSIVIFLLAFIGCKEKTDIEFAKAFFENLADGKASVMDDIDWENFAGTGFDIGGKLKGVSDISEKKDLKKSFINSFGETFKKSGFKLQNISNWIIEDTNNIRTIVSCEIGQDNYLYLVILKKIDNERKVSSVMISNIDLKLPSEFCSSIKYDPISSVRISTFPSSLIDKYIKSKEKKDAELIKKKGYTKRTRFEKTLPSENWYITDSLPLKSYDLFDTSGYLIKKEQYNEVSDVKLINEKKGLYEEICSDYKYYYTMIDSLKYKIHIITHSNHTSIYKYDKDNNLLNIAFVSDVGDYNGLVSFFYDSLENVSRRLIYQINGTLNDTLFNTKYDSSGNIIECVRYYTLGTFDKNSFLFYKCNSEYDMKGNAKETMFTALFELPEKIICTYNSKNDIVKIYYYGWFGPLFDEGGINTEYKFNDDGLLIETLDSIFRTINLTKYTYE